MAAIPMSDMTAKYVEALIRDGDKFDYSAWYRENRRSQSDAKPTDGGLDSLSAGVTPCLDNGTAEPAASVGTDLHTERPSGTPKTGNTSIFPGGDMQQWDRAAAERPRVQPLRPAAPALATKRPDQSSQPAKDTASRSTRAMKEDLAEVAEAWRKFQSSRDRDAVYAYLEGVFDLVREWERRGRADKKARRALRVRGLRG